MSKFTTICKICKQTRKKESPFIKSGTLLKVICKKCRATAKKNKREKVILMMQNGCVELVKKPENIDIVLKDYDIQEEENTKKDKWGKYLKCDIS